MRINHTIVPEPKHVDCKGTEIRIGDVCCLSDERVEGLLLLNDENPDPFAPFTKGWEIDPKRKYDREQIGNRLKNIFSIVGYQGEWYLISTNHSGRIELGYVASTEIVFLYRMPTKEG